MIEFLTIVTSITGVFTLLDLFVEKQAKAKIAEYVFGFGEVNLRGFESNVIRALLSIYKTGDRISFRKVLFRYSGVVALITILGMILSALLGKLDFLDIDPSEFLELSTIWELPFAIVIAALMYWPFDSWSLWVTNKIFGQADHGSLIKYMIKVLVDIFVTLAPMILISIAAMYCIMQIDEDSIFAVISSFVLTATVVNALGSLLITFVQVLTLLMGMFFRMIMRLTKLNQRIAMVSRAHEFPFTFIGLVIAISGALIATFGSLGGSVPV